MSDSIAIGLARWGVAVLVIGSLSKIFIPPPDNKPETTTNFSDQQSSKSKSKSDVEKCYQKLSDGIDLDNPAHIECMERLSDFEQDAHE